MTVLAASGKAGPADGDPAGQPLLGGLHIATLVMRRTRQLEDGARPHTDPGRHKLFRCALTEVLSGAISWSVPPEATAGPASA